LGGGSGGWQWGVCSGFEVFGGTFGEFGGFGWKIERIRKDLEKI
jgi:hypothetical protein